MTQQNRETLLALADRAEKATGPDRELDAASKEAFGHIRDYAADWGPRGKDRPVAKPYTASLDAAMSLRPEGWRWVLRQATADECKGAFFCRLESGDFKSITWGKGGEYITDVISGVDVFCWAATPALALCGASLRAHATLDPTGDKA